MRFQRAHHLGIKIPHNLEGFLSTGSASLGQTGVLRAVVGAGLYLAVLGLLALGLATVIRHTTGAISAFALVVLVLPLIVQALPTSISDAVARYLPANIGLVMFSTDGAPDRLGPAFSPWAGFALLVLYAVVVLGIGCWVQRRLTPSSGPFQSVRSLTNDIRKLKRPEYESSCEAALSVCIRHPGFETPKGTGRPINVGEEDLQILETGELFAGRTPKVGCPPLSERRETLSGIRSSKPEELIGQRSVEGGSGGSVPVVKRVLGHSKRALGHIG
jgi:hypothetical protein